MGDNLIGENLMDLDLNQEPLDPRVDSDVTIGSFQDELETSNGSIEERIRQLEAVTARTRYRQRWRQARNSMVMRPYSGGQMVNVDGEIGFPDGVDSVNALERTGEREKGCKRDSSHLVANALEMDSEVKKVESDGGSFFDCNICLDTAREPVLTCCGHLFCWACFYQVSYLDSTCKECPVCKGEVSDSAVIPIYGNGGDDSMLELESESGLKIPPRPKARRVESVRQQHTTGTIYQIPVAEALRRIRISIGAMGDQRQELGGVGSLSFQSDTSELQNAETAVSQLLRPQQYSRVLSERALRSAERLVEDVENVDQLLSVHARNPLIRNSTFIQSGRHQPPDLSGGVVHTPSMRTFDGINQPVAHSFSSFLRRTRRRLS